MDVNTFNKINPPHSNTNEVRFRLVKTEPPLNKLLAACVLPAKS